MPDHWDDIGYVISSRYRTRILVRLATGPATPSRIAEEEAMAVPHVSRALGELRERALVELLVPEDRQKGRLYGITDRGRDAFERIERQGISYP